MKLTLRQEWRPRPLNSFLGCVDIKLGVTIALLFAVLNKVAGIYGLLAVFTGMSFAQVSMYIYSVLTLIALGWGLNAVAEEDPKRTLYFAHLFFADHVLSTAWTVFFAVVWWIYTPHDGRRQANSAAQEQMMLGGTGHNLTEEERTQAAMMIWNKEKGTAAAVLVAGWFAKIYFAALLYSYAIHLRKGSYRSLPSTSLSSSQYIALNTTNSNRTRYPSNILAGEDDEDIIDDFYRVPSASATIVNSTPTVGSVPVHVSASSSIKTPVPGSGGGGSITSFADFVSAPGRGRRFRGNAPASASLSGSAIKDSVPEEDMDDEVLFDSDELGGGGGMLSSKYGTEESTSVSSREDDALNLTGRRTPIEVGMNRSGHYGR